MELWIAGEVFVDVNDEYRQARTWIVSEVNKELDKLSLISSYRQWFVIAIILPTSMGEDYPERTRRHKKDNSLEFRLRIDHQEFKTADPIRQREMFLDALSRSIDVMSKFDVPEDDRAKLQAILNAVRARSGARQENP